MTKPIIGVTTSLSKGYIMWRCTHLAISLFGGKAVRINSESEYDYKLCKGYIISGGADINPKLYNQENTSSYDIEPERDGLEQKVIQHALDEKKPLLGICRGAQIINVCLGGTLHQDVQSSYQGFIPTTSLLKKIVDRRKISLTYKKGILSNIVGEKDIYVNSIHHQSIDSLGKGLVVSAIGDFGVVQAIESTGENMIVGVQWHPELMLYSKRHRSFFRYLMNIVKAKK